MNSNDDGAHTGKSPLVWQTDIIVGTACGTLKSHKSQNLVKVWSRKDQDEVKVEG